MKFIRELILDGKIPHFRIIKLVALVLSFLPIPVFFLTHNNPREFGELGWQFLIAIMLIRPLSNILPGIGILRSLVPFRKEVGIACAWLIILHSYGIFANMGKNILTEIFNPEYWRPGHPLMWGILGFLAVILLLITSNNYSIKRLRKNWKRVQMLVYPLFFFTAVHIALISGETSKIVLPVLAVMVLWILAQFKVKIPLFIKPEKHENE